MSKLITMPNAISRFVPDGSSAALGLALEGLIPFAAGHEIIRQGVRDLTLIGPISDILFDQIIGAGCVRKAIAAWVGNVIIGSGYNFRRAVEGGHIEAVFSQCIRLKPRLRQVKEALRSCKSGKFPLSSL